MENFADLTAGLSPDFLADFLDVDLRTVKNWRTGKTTPPAAVFKLVRLMLNGDLDSIGGTDWQGFALRQGQLFAPLHGRPFSADQLKGMFFDIQAARWFKRRANALENQVQELRERVAELQAEADRLRQENEKLAGLVPSNVVRLFG